MTPAAAPSLTPTRGARARATADLFRVLSLNTHRGRGPDIRVLRRNAEPGDARRLDLLHDTRAYTYLIAEWLGRRRGRYDAVGLQEVWDGALGLGGWPFSRFAQADYYRELSGFRTALAHRVGFAGFRYSNLLLLRRPLERPEIHAFLPGRVCLLAACGFTLAPVEHAGRTVWVGNTHLHANDPRKRARQASAIAEELRKLGDVPVVFLGDMNTTPPGCRDGDFPEGDRDVRSYRDDATLRVLAEAGLRMVPHDDVPEFHTYPTGARNRTLDYVLFSRHWQVEDHRVVHDMTLSDHHPVEAVLRLRNLA